MTDIVFGGTMESLMVINFYLGDRIALHLHQCGKKSMHAVTHDHIL
jgi:hypothetical protein